MARPATPAIELFRFPGLLSSRITLHTNSPSVRRPASHNDVGLNYLERGWAVTLTASGQRYRLEPGG